LPCPEELLAIEKEKQVIPSKQKNKGSGKETAAAFKYFTSKDISLLKTPSSAVFNRTKRDMSTMDDFKENEKGKKRDIKYKDKMSSLKSYQWEIKASALSNLETLNLQRSKEE
jgi:hypothetical protein